MRNNILYFFSKIYGRRSSSFKPNNMITFNEDQERIPCLTLKNVESKTTFFRVRQSNIKIVGQMKKKAGKGLAFRQISFIFASNNASGVAYVAHPLDLGRLLLKGRKKV